MPSRFSKKLLQITTTRQFPRRAQFYLKLINLLISRGHKIRAFNLILLNFFYLMKLKQFNNRLNAFVSSSPVNGLLFSFNISPFIFFKKLVDLNVRFIRLQTFTKSGRKYKSPYPIRWSRLRSFVLRNFLEAVCSRPESGFKNQLKEEADSLSDPFMLNDFVLFPGSFTGIRLKKLESDIIQNRPNLRYCRRLIR